MVFFHMAQKDTDHFRKKRKARYLPGFLNTPKGSRTPVRCLRTSYPGPLDDGGKTQMAIDEGTVRRGGIFVKCFRGFDVRQETCFNPKIVEFRPNLT